MCPYYCYHVPSLRTARAIIHHQFYVITLFCKLILAEYKTFDIHCCIFILWLFVLLESLTMSVGCVGGYVQWMQIPFLCWSLFSHFIVFICLTFVEFMVNSLTLYHFKIKKILKRDYCYNKYVKKSCLRKRWTGKWKWYIV
jgi:hypothetical protein